MITVYGAGEVARRKEVTDAAVSMWLARYDDTPEPAVVVVSGKSRTYGWDEAGIKAWEAWKPPSKRPAVMPVVVTAWPEDGAES